MHVAPGQPTAVGLSLAAGMVSDVATRLLSPREQARVDEAPAWPANSSRRR